MTATASGVAPHVFVYADRGDPVEPLLVIDQGALALGQYRVVGGVPRDPEPFGATSDVQVLHDDRFRAHRSPRRESFARGSAAALVSCRHT